MCAIAVARMGRQTGVAANGYRSLVRVVATLTRHCTELLETIKHQQATLGYGELNFLKVQFQF